MKKLAIMVAAHKAYEFPADVGYVPVQVGRAIAGHALPFDGDDTGASISDMNRSFCELTGLYWMWKNVRAEAYGLSHYRRYFRPQAAGVEVAGQRVASSEELSGLLARYDIVLSRPRNYWIESVRKHYENAHHGEDLVALERVIRERSPEYLHAFDETLSRTRVSLYNMFVMRESHFDAYCRWLFDILFELRNRIAWQDYGPYQGRVFGFLGERLLNVWTLHNIPAERVAYLPVVNLEGEDLVEKAKGLLKRKFTGAKLA
jgi:hypothetical protein